MTAMVLPVLRYGVVLGSANPTVWQAAVLDHLRLSGDAELAVVVIGPGTGPMVRPRSGGRADRGSYRGRVGAIAWRFLATRLSRAKGLRAVAAVPWASDVAIVRWPGASSATPGDTGFDDDAAAALSNHNLDFLLALDPVPAAIMTRVPTRLGTWSFQHGESGAGPHAIGFWELVEGQSTVRTTLHRRTGGGEGATVLREGWFATAPASFARTRDRVLLGSAAWPAHVCRALRHGAPTDDRMATEPAVSDRAPGLGAVLRCLSLGAAAMARYYWHHGLRHDDWNIGIVDQSVASILERAVIPEVQWAPGQRGHYAADPFGRWDGTELEVMYEDYAHALGVASIARRTWTRADGWRATRQALDIGTHLSYPFLLDHGGRRLMLPESRASGRLELYEADAAGNWRAIGELGLGRDVADATLVHHDNRWWLFAVAADRLNRATDLYLWSADRPEGPWTEHPQNPVVVDVRSARPGGAFFQLDGRLHRPAQDCSTGYGDRLAIKRVVTLTVDHYEEELVCVLGPERGGAYPHGLHTLTSIGDVTLVDGKRYVWDTRALIRGVRVRLPFRGRG
jgi:hypothetical protein